MFDSSAAVESFFAPCFNSRRMRRKPSQRKPAARIEALESRIAPATFAGTGGPSLDITLDQNNEAITITSTGTTYTITSGFAAVDGGNTGGHVSGFGSTTAVIDAAAFTTIRITDTASTTFVAFGASGANIYTSAFDIVLDDPTAAGLAFAGASTFNAPLTASVPGDIVQSGPVISTSTVSLTSTFGEITLTGAGNNFKIVSLETSGNNAIALRTLAGITLDEVKTETGNFSLFAGGTISQTSSGQIIVGGTTTIDLVAGTNIVVSLPGSENFFGGPVIFTETGGDYGIIQFRNTSPTATLPDLTDLAAGDLGSLQIVFDGAGIAIDAATEDKVATTGTLSVTAGGSITQTAPITLSTLSVTALGNNGITLTDSGNLVTGAVSLNNRNADGGLASAVSYVENGGILLGTSNLGLGTLSITAFSGNISQSGAIRQQLGAGSATFTLTAGNTLDLSTQENLFAGAVRVFGAAVTDVLLRDTNTLAALPDLADVTDTLTDLELQFDRAPAVLPSYNLQTLTVEANGIYQKLGSALLVSGNADFNAGSFEIDLPNTGNDFTTLRLQSSGREDVSVFDLDDLAFGGGNSDVGTGRLTVVAAGAITQSANRIKQATAAGPASFSGASITLNRPANDFTGPVLLNSGAVTVVDTNSIILGKVSSGALSVTAGNNITQLAGSNLSVGGTALFDSGGGASVITLDNSGNSLRAGIRLVDGNVTLRNETIVNFTGATSVASLRVTAGGAMSQAAGSTVLVSGITSLDAGINAINLGLLANDFAGAVSVASTGAVTLGDLNGIQLGTVKLGAAAFAVEAGGNVTQVAGGAITQTGPGTLSLLGGASNDVTLDQTGNNFLGTILVNANNVNLTTSGDLNFAPGADIDGNLTLRAGGKITLPSGNLTDLGTTSLIASRTIVGTNLATDSGSGIFTLGAVEFASGVTINTSANNGQVTFNGDVTALGPLTFTVGTKSVVLTGGTWNQGSSNLTISTTGVTAFEVGTAEAIPATFVMTGGTLSINGAAGGSAMRVLQNGTFRVGANAGAAEVVTIDTGATGGTVNFGFGSTLEVGFGATNDKLVVDGTGAVTLSSARLIGSGAAGATPSPVLEVTGGGVLRGAFKNSLTLGGDPQAFLAGSDIVTAGYLPSSASIGLGGPAPAASFTGYLPDGDRYTVTHSAGAAAGLVVIQNEFGQIDVAVRNNAAAGTLNIVTTKFSGDGLTEVGGIGANGAGAITINAATSNLRGDLRVQNALTALTIRDVLVNTNSALPHLIHAGGAASSVTSITGHHFDGVTIEIGGVLSSLKAARVSTGDAAEPAQITAERFGTITITGDAANELTGLFDARLTNRNTLAAPVALTGFTGAELSNTWDLKGSVGSVTVSKTSFFWHLGASGAGAVNSRGVTSAGNLSLADALNSSISVSGAITGVKVTHVDELSITAKTLGTFSAVADLTKANQFGNVDGLLLTLTGNQAGLALKSLSVVASLSNSTLRFLDGNVGAFTVGRELSDSFLVAEATALGGRFTALTVGEWDNSDLDAKSVGTLKVIGNALAGEFGGIQDSLFTIRGQAAGVGIGTVSASGEIYNSSFLLRAGGMTSLTAARGISDSFIMLGDATLGNLKTITVASWENTDLTARTVGTMKVTGAPQVGPASPLIIGHLVDSAILAFADTGILPAIGIMAVAGNLSDSTVTAHRGLTALTVGRTLDNSTVTADDLLTGQLTGLLTVGRIGTVTLGESVTSSIVATMLGKINVTGFTAQEGSAPFQSLGGVSGGTILAKGAMPSGTKAGLDSLTVAGSMAGTFVSARSGAGSFTVRGHLTGAELTFDNPLDLTASGKVGMVSAGRWDETTLRANVVTTLQTVASAINAASGSFEGEDSAMEVTIAASSGAAADPVALTTFTVARDLADIEFNVPAGVKTFKVAGIVESSDVAAGFAPNARIASITASAWESTDLTTRALTALNVTGNSARAIAGNITDSLLTIMGNTAGVGLGTLFAQGTVRNTTFQVTDGNVTSFIVGRFLDSNLYVGFRPDSTIDLTQGGLFGATDRTIALFKTTQPFDPTDPDSISFANSHIVAADLGAITLTGVAPAADRPITFGIGFETGGTAGIVKADTGAGLVTLTSPFTTGGFTYRGL